MKRYIYADNAATTKLDTVAFEAMKPFLLHEYGNPSQLYSFSRIPKRAIREAQETIASCIGALPEEIFSHPVALKVITGPSKVQLFLTVRDELRLPLHLSIMQFCTHVKQSNNKDIR